MNFVLQMILIMIAAVIFGVWFGFEAIEYKDNQYIQEHNSCVSDCERAGQEFFDYMRRNCYCLLDKQVNTIW